MPAAAASSRLLATQARSPVYIGPTVFSGWPATASPRRRCAHGACVRPVLRVPPPRSSSAPHPGRRWWLAYWLAPFTGTRSPGISAPATRQASAKAITPPRGHPPINRFADPSPAPCIPRIGLPAAARRVPNQTVHLALIPVQGHNRIRTPVHQEPETTATRRTHPTRTNHPQRAPDTKQMTALDPRDQYPPQSRSRSGRPENLKPWQKGRSGNPRVRPPRVRDLSDFELAADTITARAVGMTLGAWIRQRRHELQDSHAAAHRLKMHAREIRPCPCESCRTTRDTETH